MRWLGGELAGRFFSCPSCMFQFRSLLVEIELFVHFWIRFYCCNPLILFFKGEPKNNLSRSLNQDPRDILNFKPLLQQKNNDDNKKYPDNRRYCQQYPRVLFKQFLFYFDLTIKSRICAPSSSAALSRGGNSSAIIKSEAKKSGLNIRTAAFAEFMASFISSRHLSQPL